MRRGQESWKEGCIRKKRTRSTKETSKIPSGCTDRTTVFCGLLECALVLRRQEERFVVQNMQEKSTVYSVAFPFLAQAVHFCLR